MACLSLCLRVSVVKTFLIPFCRPRRVPVEVKKMINRRFQLQSAILTVAISSSAAVLPAQPRHVIEGHLNPRAASRFDQGPADPDTRLEMTVVLKRTAAQQSSLDQLL